MISFASPSIRIYLPTVLYMAAIFTFSCMSRIDLPFLDRLSADKIYHVIEYSVLGYLVIRALEQGFRMQGTRMIVLAIIIGALYGWSDEIHQYFVPGRYYSYWDIAADSTGSALGVWIYLKLRL